MLRWIGKKILFCIVLLVLFSYLNVKNPHWMQNLGRWIGGEVGNKVSVAVSNMMDKIGENTGLREVVEVFGEDP